MCGIYKFSSGQEREGITSTINKIRSSLDDLLFEESEMVGFEGWGEGYLGQVYYDSSEKYGSRPKRINAKIPQTIHEKMTDDLKIVKKDLIDTYSLTNPRIAQISSWIDTTLYTLKRWFLEMADTTLIVGARGLWDEENDADIDQVKTAKRFLVKYGEKCQSGKGSYGLKHIIERKEEAYISNGALIEAALDLGLKLKNIKKENPNVLICVQRKGWNSYYKKTPFCNWLRNKAIPSNSDEKTFIQDTIEGYSSTRDAYLSFNFDPPKDSLSNHKDFKNPEDFHEKFSCRGDNLLVDACHSLYEKFRKDHG